MNDTLESIMDDCAKMRGCYPLTYRVVTEFFNWIMTEKGDEMIPLALEFKSCCETLYDGDADGN